MIIGSKNKGNWSEFYSLVYLLAKKKIIAADENLNAVEDYYFPVIKVMRNEKRHKTGKTDYIEFIISNCDGLDTIELYIDSEFIKKIPSKEFCEESKKLYEDIKKGEGSTINISHGEEFLNKLELECLAAPPTEIADIELRVHDTNTARNQNMGFSIKSYIGGAPTLLNASPATNFVYEITGLTDEQMEEINSINAKNKIVERINRIIEYGGKFIYSRTANSSFSANMILIDTCMEKIVADMLLCHYTTKKRVKCLDILSDIEERNPLNYPRKGMYTYKFKKFLCAKALGMEPSAEWGGMEEANGGYIAVKSDGEVLAYFLYDRGKFEKYLLENTKFERGSTSRHNFASLYKEDGKMYMNLNLQIRFLDNH